VEIEANPRFGHQTFVIMHASDSLANLIGFMSKLRQRRDRSYQLVFAKSMEVCQPGLFLLIGGRTESSIQQCGS
jgi:hypothetical protein